MMYIILIIT
jgi:hypothetical protein